MKPKILIIIDTATIGGPGRGVFQLLENSTREEFEYSLCTFRYKNPKSTEFIDTATRKSFPIQFLKEDFRLDPRTLGQASEICSTGNFSIVQSHGYKSHIVALYLSWKFRLPWLALTHGWTNESWKMEVYRIVEKFLLKRADHVVTVAPTMYSEIGELRGSRRPTELILNAIDENLLQGSEDGTTIRTECKCEPDSVLIGSIGRLSPEKGHRDLLEAFATCYLENPKLRLVIVGEGCEQESLKNLALEKGISEVTFFHSYTSEIKNYYQAINLFVLPSWSEGLPNVLLEAMSINVPCLATDVGAVREVIQDSVNGWIVPPRDPAALASSINTILKDRSKLKLVTQMVRKSLFPKFDPRARAEKFVSLYRALTK